MNRTETMHVLIAEDDALINEGIASQLIRLGHTPSGQAYDGLQAVHLACEQRPAVVLMDLQMIDPETGREDPQAGLKAARTIQQRCPAAVVVLTAHESPDLVVQAAEAGVSGYLIKPTSDHELDRTIRIARARFTDVQKTREKADELELRQEAMRTALARRRIPAGLLGVCAWCKKIRNEEGTWQTVEGYLKDRWGTTVTHGICPECHRGNAPWNRSGLGGP
jgi:DNA-binding NarL/FixJ family response regulator